MPYLFAKKSFLKQLTLKKCSSFKLATKNYHVHYDSIIFWIIYDAIKRPAEAGTKEILAGIGFFVSGCVFFSILEI